MDLKPNDAHLIFDGETSTLKMFVPGEQTPRHLWPCHDVGVNDENPPDGDEYGYRCKCPPGHGYIIGSPQPLNPPQPPYGYFFTPIADDPAGDFRLHGREGVGIHGGGSDLTDPFAPYQGWEWTFGCLRLQNADNELFVRAVAYIQAHGGTVYLDVVWP